MRCEIWDTFSMKGHDRLPSRRDFGFMELIQQENFCPVTYFHASFMYRNENNHWNISLLQQKHSIWIVY
jgi:hypothetical protein